MVHTSKQQDTAARYTAAWRQMRRRFWQLIAWWLGIPVLLMVLGMMVRPQNDTLVHVGVGGWGTGFFVLAYRHFFMPCPRCGKAFYLKGLYGHPYARRCLHCKLPKGTSGPESPP